MEKMLSSMNILYIFEALSKLYTAMYTLSHAPVEMKRGNIITLHKGGSEKER